MSDHRIKKVAPAATKPQRSARELVTLYGDSWAIASQLDGLEWSFWRNCVTDRPHDDREYLLMKLMERGQIARCE